MMKKISLFVAIAFACAMYGQGWPIEIRGYNPTIVPTQDGGVILSVSTSHNGQIALINQRRDAEAVIVWADTILFQNIQTYPSHIFLHRNKECTFFALDTDGLHFFRYDSAGTLTENRYQTGFGFEWANTIHFDENAQEFLRLTSSSAHRISSTGVQQAETKRNVVDYVTQFGRKVGTWQTRHQDVLLYINTGDYPHDGHQMLHWDPVSNTSNHLNIDPALQLPYSLSWYSLSQGNIIALSDSTIVTSHVRPLSTGIHNPVVRVQRYLRSGALIASFDVELFDQPFFQDDSDLWADTDSTLIFSLGSTWCRTTLDGDVLATYRERRRGLLYGSFYAHQKIASDSLGFAFFAYSDGNTARVVRKRLDAQCPPEQHIDTFIPAGMTFRDIEIVRDTIVSDTLIDQYTGCVTPVYYHIFLETALTNGFTPHGCIILMPNPVSDQLYTTLPEGHNFVGYRIYDVTGHIWKRSPDAVGQRFSIPVEDLPAGSFFLYFPNSKFQPALFVVAR